MEPKLDLPNITLSSTLSSEDDHIGGYEFIGLPASDTITLSALNYNNTVIGGGYTNPSTVTLSPNTFSNVTGVTGSPYTFSAGTNTSPWTSYTGTPKIQLDGEGADIEVNGWSLVNAIKQIEQRLNILTPNTKLETEWEELRALGEQYRNLEQHIKDKQATWDKLISMPPPVID
jgi:hypothetical protein